MVGYIARVYACYIVYIAMCSRLCYHGYIDYIASIVSIASIVYESMYHTKTFFAHAKPSHITKPKRYARTYIYYHV